MPSKQVEARLDAIGGSDANIILSGDEEQVLKLWRVKRREEVPESMSDRLPVMLGCWTEAFNRQWYEKMTGYAVSAEGATLSCNRHSWRRCTLDGFVSAAGAVWEAKHTSAFSKPDELLRRYMPQLQHNMAVAKAERAVLSVIFGNHKWEVFEVEADWLYQEDLLIAETRFWDCVRKGERPVAAPVPQPPRVKGVREIGLEGNNAWASAAADWLTNRQAAKLHASAAASIRELVEDDVARAFGHGIEARRSKSGAVTIRELAK
jgi:predicted phage-related endonuclease